MGKCESSRRQPLHFCDYCDVFLTHDSASVRRAHNAGRNHLTNVRDYYSSLGHDKAQDLIDQITKMYESGGPPPGRPFPSAPMSMGPGPLNPMGGMRPPFGGPPGMMGGPPQQFNPQQQFQQPPPQFQQQQPPPFGQNPPMHFGQGQGPPGMAPPPMFFGGGGPPPMAPPPGFRPPPGMAPPPGFFGAGGPGATISSGPSMSAPLPSGAPVSASGEGPKQSGMNPERARMLGLL